jgi:putative heme iron utilization protein
VSQTPFGPDVIAAVSRHMNADHTTDSLVIVRALGDTPEATAARVTHLDGDGVDFAVTVDDGGSERTVRVPFARPLTERPEIRAEFVRLYTEAATALGIEPRTESGSGH